MIDLTLTLPSHRSRIGLRATSDASRQWPTEDVLGQRVSVSQRPNYTLRHVGDLYFVLIPATLSIEHIYIVSAPAAVTEAVTMPVATGDDTEEKDD